MSTDDPTVVTAVHVYRKHAPWHCDCGFELDGCCAPSTCPKCGRPTARVLNAGDGGERGAKR